MRCSLSLASMSARVSVRADDRDVALELEQVGHGADVVLVAVGEDDRLDVVEPVGDVGEVRQDEVDSGVVVLGEEHAAVDDEQLALRLEDGHVAADLAEPAERDDPQAVVGEGGGRGQLGVGVAHRCPVIRWCCRAVGGSGQRSWGGHPTAGWAAVAARAARAARTRAVCSSSAGTSGRRTAGDSMSALHGEAGLGHDRALGDVHDGVDDRGEASVHGAGVVPAPVDDGVGHLAVGRGRHLGRDADEADGAVDEVAEVHGVVAGVPVEAGLLHHLAREPEVAAGVLHGGDAVVLGDAQVGLAGDGDARPAGDVVDHDGQVARVGEGGEVGDEAGLRRLVVVRRDGEHGVGAGLLRVAHRLDALGGVVAAGAGDDDAAVADGLDDGAEQLVLLVGEVVGDSPVVPETTRPS